MQRVYSENTTYSSTTAAFTYGDAIPPNTGGTQIITATIAPLSSSNILRFTVNVPFANNVACYTIIGLFQDSTVNALAANVDVSDTADYMHNVPLFFEMAAGTTSSTTFKIRIGNNGCTTYINGNSSGRRFGGALRATMIVEELNP